MISAAKWAKLRAWMAELSINEDTLDEKFILGSGRGGQKIQKTASCVYLKDTVSGIEVKCQKTRFRDDNRYLARQLLCEKIDELKNQEKSRKQQAIEKIKRQKRRRSRKAKEKMLKEKKRVTQKKEQRKKPSEE